MDDYILRILTRQKLREEAETEAVWEKQRNLSRELPEGGNVQETQRADGMMTEQGSRREGALYLMLKSMEPLNLSLPEEKARTTENFHGTGAVPYSLSRLSGVVFGQKSQQLTPEGLSMFYQRDARRFS